MGDTYIELEDIPVLRLRAELGGNGPSAAFTTIEGKLPTVKGRKFYGTFRFTAIGPEYHACVARVDSDDPVKMQLETATIPGGWYARRKLMEWRTKLAELPNLFQEMARSHDVDPARPSVEV